MMPAHLKEVVLFGAGNLAANVVAVLRDGDVDVIGYISTERPGSIINNLPVLGDLDYYRDHDDLQKKSFHIAIGENSVRYSIFEAIKFNIENMGNVISGDCIMSNECLLDRGTYIGHGAIIQHDVSIGVCCIVDTGVILEHNVMIGNFVNISPGSVLCGGVRVSNGAIIGAGSTVIEKIHIGENALIGAGSVVINDIEPNVVAVGNPARGIRKRNFTDTYIK